MKTKTAKKATEILLDGITAELHIVDGTIKGVTLLDRDGRLLTVQNNGWGSGIEVLIPDVTPPKMEKAFRLKGAIKLIPFDETFKERWAADARLRDLAELADAPLAVEEFERPAEEE